MVPEQYAVADGLFLDTASGPRLLCGRCPECALPHFPRGKTCPYCGAGGCVGIEGGPDAALWAWTAVTAAPPGYRGEVPYGFGIVELTGGPAAGLRVVTRLTEPDPAALSQGEAMSLALAPLHVDDAGREVVAWAFAPTAAALR